MTSASGRPVSDQSPTRMCPWYWVLAQEDKAHNGRRELLSTALYYLLAAVMDYCVWHATYCYPRPPPPPPGFPLALVLYLWKGSPNYGAWAWSGWWQTFMWPTDTLYFIFISIDLSGDTDRWQGEIDPPWVFEKCGPGGKKVWKPLI